MKQLIKLVERMAASVIRGARSDAQLALRGRYRVECRDADGNLKWTDFIENLVTDAGEDHALESTLGAGTQITTWYLGLTDSAPTVAETDTMASHAGWVEDQNYTEGTRVTCSFGATSGQSIDNSASPAAFSINATTTIGGAFLTSDNTKGGTTGTLYSVGAFSGGDKSVSNGDTLNVTYTATAAGA